MDVRRRILEKTKGDDEEVSYELDAPKLIVEKTFEAVQKSYEFKVSDYSELSKCKWFNIVIDETNATSTPIGNCIAINFDGKYIGQTEITTNKYYSFIIEESNGLWNMNYTSRGNIGTTISNVMRMMNGAIFSKYAPVENLIKIVGSNTNNYVLADNTTIKIYGFY